MHEQSVTSQTLAPSSTPSASSQDVRSAVPTAQEVLDEIRRGYTEQDKAEAWSKTAEMVKTYSDEMVKRWNAEIDTLLVYGGLFSAILTAFNVQSYQLLQPAGPDPALAALQQISAQLSSFSVHLPFVNSTRGAFVLLDAPSPTAPRWAVWLNSLWFAGLICSIAAASIGIMVKQWLHEFLSGLSGTSREIARRRQYRLRNLSKWRVAQIVAVLPVLLQSSLVLFLAGLLVLLWQLHRDVAIVASVLIGVLLTFMMGTTLLSALIIDCCYISPVTFVIYPLTEWVQHGFRSLSCAFFQSLQRHSDSSVTLQAHLPHIPDSWRRPRPIRTRRGRGVAGIEGQREMLDSDQVRTAYELTLDTTFLATIGTTCLVDLGDEVAVSIIDHIAAIDYRHRLGDLTDILDPPVDFWAHALLRMTACLSAAPAVDPKVMKVTESHANSWIIWKSRRAEGADRAARILASLSEALSKPGHPYATLLPNVNGVQVALGEYRLNREQDTPARWESVRYAFDAIRCSSLPLSSIIPQDGDVERTFKRIAEYLSACSRLPDAPPECGKQALLWAHERQEELQRLQLEEYKRAHSEESKESSSS